MIFKDRRHTECTVVMDVPSDRRLYRDWDMRVEDMHAIALPPGLPGPVWFQGAWQVGSLVGTILPKQVVNLHNECWDRVLMRYEKKHIFEHRNCYMLSWL